MNFGYREHRIAIAFQILPISHSNLFKVITQILFQKVPKKITDAEIFLDIILLTKHANYISDSTCEYPITLPAQFKCLVDTTQVHPYLENHSQI